MLYEILTYIAATNSTKTFYCFAETKAHAKAMCFLENGYPVKSVKKVPVAKKRNFYKSEK